MGESRKVLILCTGNSCRSQMAEGMINHYLGDDWHAVSAGTEPSGYVHPLAIEVMAELGIDISAGKSESVERYRSTRFDRVITVCDDAHERCPVWPASGTVTHIGFVDPAQATGSPEEIVAVFRRVRDQIRLTLLANLLEATPDNP